MRDSVHKLKRERFRLEIRKIFFPMRTAQQCSWGQVGFCHLCSWDFQAPRSWCDAKPVPALGMKLRLRAPEMLCSLNYTMVLLMFLALQQKFLDCNLVCLLLLVNQFHFLGLQLNLRLRK